MKNFDHFELDPNNNRVLACGVDERGQAHKTLIRCLSGIGVNGNRVIVFDDESPMFILETSSEDEAIQKNKELTAFINKHCRDSPSFFKP